MGKKKKTDKRKDHSRIPTAILVCVFIVFAAYVCYYVVDKTSTSLEKMPEYIAAADYKNVVKTYNEYIANDEARKEDNDPAIKDLISEIRVSWDTYSMSTEEATSALNVLIALDSYLLSEEAKKQCEYITIESESEKLYNTAENYYQKGEYFEALKTLVTINKGYSQNDIVEDFCKQCEEALVVLVSYPTSKKEYEDCQKKIEEYLKVRKCPEFTKQKKKLADEKDEFMMVASSIEKARSAFDKGEYEESFDILVTAQKNRPDNRFIAETLDELHNVFIVSKAQEVNDLIHADKKDEAVKAAMEAKRIYNSEETEFIVEYALENKSGIYVAINNVIGILKSWKTEEFDVHHEAGKAGAYILKSGKKMFLGDYDKEKVTLLSMVGELGSSLIGLDLPMDVRDISYDISHWGEGEYFEMRLVTDAVALVPIIGTVKYLKYSDEAGLGIKTASKILGTSKVSPVIRNMLNNSTRFTTNANQSALLTKILLRHYDPVNSRLEPYVGKCIGDTDITVARKVLEYSNTRRVVGFFPQFDYKYEIKLDPEYYLKGRGKHKSICQDEMKERAEKGELKDKFTKAEINDFLNGKTPAAYDWHHSEEEGVMQLVKKTDHKKGHKGSKGGFDLWGKEYGDKLESAS